jgi:hypothetical protein
MKVTEAHLKQFEEEGYVVIEGVLTDDDLEPIIQDYIAFIDEKARELHSQGKLVNLYAEEPFETRLARIVEDVPDGMGNTDIGATRRRDTFEFLRNTNLLDAIEPFVGPELTCNAISHMRPKMPREDVGFHQDAVFTTQEAHHILQLTVWLPLMDVDEENGCMQVRPGIHKRKKVFWQYGRDLPEEHTVTLPMKKGDVLFVHKLTPHGSGLNHTDQVRWSMDLRYQKTGGPSPRPEWPSSIVRSRQDSATETKYEAWRDAWAAGLEKTPKQFHYERPSETTDYTGEMFLSAAVT